MEPRIENTVTRFTGIDGRQHRIGYLSARGNAGQLLVDDYQGHGLRLICVMKLGEDNGDQADAVIREYRVEAATTDRPLSRRVKPEEIARTSSLVTAC